MRPQPSSMVLDWFAQQEGIEFYTSAITQAELLLGVALLPGGKCRDAIAGAVEQIFDPDFVGRCLPFDELAAHEYAALVATRNKVGMPISTEDHVNDYEGDQISDQAVGECIKQGPDLFLMCISILSPNLCAS